MSEAVPIWIITKSSTETDIKFKIMNNNKKKIISVVGARPNFMKVAPIHRAFLKYADSVEHLIVHTGQHYDAKMSDVFFQDLEMPQPNFFLGIGSGSHAEQTARVIIEFEKVLLQTKPDLVIVVGDVNSTIACSLTAVKMGIKVAHIEGGLRSFDRTMPEEINRIATDSICDYCFLTETSAVENLMKEGFPKERMFLVGNTMIDSQYNALERASESNILANLNLSPKDYVLATIHRPSNVDEPEQLKSLIGILSDLSKQRKIVFPVHPRTKKNIENYGLLGEGVDSSRIILTEPVGYIDFLALMENSDFVLTDSGGIQEETTVLGVPCITIRPSTERPVTCELGTNVLVYPSEENIRKALEEMLTLPRKSGTIPPLWDGHTAERIADIIINKCLN